MNLKLPIIKEKKNEKIYMEKKIQIKKKQSLINKFLNLKKKKNQQEIKMMKLRKSF